MGNHLGFANLTVVSCLLATACAPTDEEEDPPLAHQGPFDAGGGDATGADRGDVDANVPPYDPRALDGGTREDAAAPTRPPVKPPLTPPVMNGRDAGAPTPDASALDAGTAEPDAGTVEPDAAPPEPDAGTSEPDASAPPPDAGTPSTTTFSQVYAIISEKCAFCHVTDHIGSSLGHLDMSTKAAAYRNLVGQPAQGIDCGGTGHVRVVAKSPEQSLIIHKLSGTADCGVQMPDNYPPLSRAQIEVFRRWIKAGAKND